MNAIRMIVSAAAVAGALVVGQSAQAQISEIATAPEKGVWLEVDHPSFKELDVTGATSIWYLGGRMPVMDRMRVVVDIPFAHAGFDGDAIFGSESNSVLGNPYLGIEYELTPMFGLQFGARAPITTADSESFADVVGYLADPMRGDAFLEDALPLKGAVTVGQAFANGLGIRARAGVTAAIYTGDDDDAETMTFADYGISGHYVLGLARLGAGLSGRWDISADEGGFSDNSLHQLGLTIDGQFGGVRPGLSLRLPLDRTYREVTEYSIGAYLQVPLR
jgi:hypothetical protein